MVDIETISSKPDAAVLAIGACVFTLDTIGETFEVIIDAKRAVQYGREDQSTRDWWASQDPHVRARMFGGTVDPVDAAQRFAEFVKRERVREVWANAPTFDCIILRHFFERTGVACPWHFRDERCARTVMNEAKEYGLNYSRAYADAKAHDALSDAIAQAKAVQIIRAAFHPKQNALL
jgi:exodeoxyribonuclease VIII